MTDPKPKRRHEWMRVGSCVRPEVYEQLMKELDQRGMTRSALVRELVEAWLERRIVVRER